MVVFEMKVIRIPKTTGRGEQQEERKETRKRIEATYTDFRELAF